MCCVFMIIYESHVSPECSVVYLVISLHLTYKLATLTSWKPFHEISYYFFQLVFVKKKLKKKEKAHSAKLHP